MMNLRSFVFGGSLALSSFFLFSCADAPGRPVAGDIAAIPSEISDFNTLYPQNCSACHGSEGKGGAAIALADPVYLSIADDAVLHQAATDGIPGTSMPAFAQSAGGMLTAKQIDFIVSGIRERWGKPDILHGTNPPPYSSAAPGDASRGSEVYAAYCSSCHGAAGRGRRAGGALWDGALWGR